MSFWEDLSPSVKRYIIIGALGVVSLLGVRACISGGGGGGAGGHAPPRGLVR
jgi:hypothetical protein